MTGSFVGERRRSWSYQGIKFRIRWYQMVSADRASGSSLVGWFAKIIAIKVSRDPLEVLYRNYRTVIASGDNKVDEDTEEGVIRKLCSREIGRSSIREREERGGCFINI